MSTTDVVSDEWIGATVKGIAGLKGIALKRIAFALGIEPSALSNKVHGRSPWSAVQLAIVADVLGVEVGDLYNGYNGLVPFPGRVSQDPTRLTRELRTNRSVTQTDWELAA